MKKLMITGGNGMLGSCLKEEFRKKFEILAPSSSELDLRSFEDVKYYVGLHSPDIILHAAAYTNVEEAERSPEECYRTNYSATLNLCNAIAGRDTKLIYISSTGCYGNYKGDPFREYDEINPTTVYHHSKIKGEEVVRDLVKNHLILRTGWLFGGSIEQKKNFVYGRYKEAKAKEKEKEAGPLSTLHSPLSSDQSAPNPAVIYSDPFQQGNPTYTTEVAEQIAVLLDENVSGTFNLVAEGHCSRYEYVKAIIEIFGLNCEVKPTEKPFERLAKVSPNEAAENFNLTNMKLNRMSPWRKGLEKYIESLKEEIES